MSKICDDLRAAILQAAMQGELINSNNETWNESTIADVCELCTGNSISENVKKTKYMRVPEGRNYIGTKDLAFDHSFNYENGVKIPFDERNFRIANRGDILLCIEGGSAGRKIGILEEDVNYGNKLCRFSPKAKLNNRFLYFYIQSPMFQEQFSNSMTGIIGGVSIKKVKVITIKYPDITEQKCIVEKVDELMACVADLEKSADALASMKKAFPDDIKASLLQAAMQGKLTEQLPEDGNAEELLEEIKAEKERLIAEGKIKKQKPLTPIADDETLFSIPKNWQWARFGEIVDFSIGKTPPRAEASYWGDDIPWVSIADMPDGGVLLTTKERISNKAFVDTFKSKICPKETLIMSFKLTVGRCSILGIGAVHNEAIISIHPIIDNDFAFRNYLKGVLPYLSNYGETKGAIKGRTLNSNSLNNLLVPVPPLSEQKRIVKRLDTLIQNINAVRDLIASEQC